MKIVGFCNILKYHLFEVDEHKFYFFLDWNKWCVSLAPNKDGYFKLVLSFGLLVPTLMASPFIVLLR